MSSEKSTPKTTQKSTPKTTQKSTPKKLGKTAGRIVELMRTNPNITISELMMAVQTYFSAFSKTLQRY